MKKKGIILLIGCCFFVVFNGCYNHKADLVSPECDTANVRLSVELNNIMVANCFNCHSAVNAPVIGDGYNLKDYNTVKNNIESLIHSIKQDSGYSFMPKDGGKLSDCDINKFIAWKNQGAHPN